MSCSSCRGHLGEFWVLARREKRLTVCLQELVDRANMQTLPGLLTATYNRWESRRKGQRGSPITYRGNRGALERHPPVITPNNNERVRGKGITTVKGIGLIKSCAPAICLAHNGQLSGQLEEHLPGAKAPYCIAGAADHAALTQVCGSEKAEP